MRARNLALLVAAAALLQVQAPSTLTGAVPQQSLDKERGRHASRAERQRISREIAAIRAELVDHHRLHPDRGGPLRAPLQALSDLWQLRGQVPSPAVAERLGLTLVGDKILVDVGVDAGQRTAVLEGVRTAGMQEQPGGDPRETVRVLATVPDLQRLAAIPGVRHLTAPRSLRVAALSEGEHATGADVWKNFVPYSGMPLNRPAKVAVIDAGFAGYEALLGSELPNSVDTAAFCGGYAGDVHGCGNLPSVDHGTAVAEIIHDMSPNSRMLLVAINLFEDVSRPGSAWQQALEYTASQGADIVSTSLGTFWDNRNGRSPLCTTAQSLAQDHVLWATSAGNDGDPCFHEHYPFLNSAISPGYPYGGYQHFIKRKDPILNEFTLEPYRSHYIVLTWNAWGGAPSDDFDLFYVCDFGAGYQLVDVSEDYQCGVPGSIPLEVVSFFNGTGAPLACAYGVVEFDPLNCRHSSGGVQFDTWPLESNATGLPECASLEEATSSYTISHPADCPDVLAAGAVCVHDGKLEIYSSRGPTLDGRIKPDFCAPDSVSTETYGSSLGCFSEVGGTAAGFPGTSSSAPHLAGALALLYEKIGGSFTLEQCRAILEKRARDIDGDRVRDNLCGKGSLCLAEGGCD